MGFDFIPWRYRHWEENRMKELGLIGMIADVGKKSGIRLDWMMHGMAFEEEIWEDVG